MESPDAKKASASKDHLLDCPITFPKIDESQLLNDARSPRFLLACKRLRIDPLELRSLSFDDFKDKNVSVEKQQVRYAMHERSRYQKLKSINDCRFSLPLTGTNATQVEADRFHVTRTLSNSWIGNELSKTGPIVQKGKSEVYLAALKPLKEIVSQAASLSRQSFESLEEKKSQKPDHSKDLLKKRNAELSRRKERAEKLRALQSEQEQAILAKEEDRAIRREAMMESWKAELDRKRAFQNNRSVSVQSRLAKLAQEKEEAAQTLHESLCRRQNAVAIKQEQSRPLTSPSRIVNPVISSGSKLDGGAAVNWRRERTAQRAADHSKHLLSEFKKQQQEFERKISERNEQARDIAKARKAKEIVLREKLASVRKRAKEIVKERTEETLEHLKRGDERLAILKTRTKRHLDIKTEIERLRYEQAQDKIGRQKAMQRIEALELEEVHAQMDRDKEERGRTLQRLLRERQMISTSVRLQKEKIQEEILNIHQKKMWHRAQQLVLELKPSYREDPCYSSTLKFSSTG